ncbi:nucleoside phosphorylase domain-containing protein [Diplogelasinospora grovesii]|uniref:Nucleoside phosphorylase domain-containing protein n=1 Tax=Diplogelasinospora grovesii TaxID=303347 RepID=A0AAN6NDH4_9PEZI|nr:nucleoside phosphorylase domain-containing protein [Diplogelasinospora grovesii]
MHGRPAGREDFEIAIICALPLESNAITYLFDEFFDDTDGEGDPYQKVDGDPNHYTTGRIGKHNVVLVLLPGMGKVLAASAAASLHASYCNVRLALIVGICGGVPGPNKNDDELFLGDVVISDALVQYDLGRRYPGGVFLRKNNLKDSFGRPNKDVRALLKSFETDRNRDKLERRTAHFLRELEATYAARTRRRPGRYKYPGADEDELFQADYSHRHRFSACCNDETTCDKALESSCDEIGCEEKYLIDRDGLSGKRNLEDEDPAKAQEPAIYIGSLASGDTVMKSGEDRDRIAKQEGILAFEMEGAGVWDEIPCIVVKGVCDYADSHKRKRWQDFAAATAASAAKALLEALVKVNRAESPIARHDMTGRYLPFHLETVSSKELFVEILRTRFKDLGCTKIDRGEWSLEDVDSGQVLDLSQPWQETIKRNQVLHMNMHFRRQKIPTAECPSCGFMNEGLPTDQIVCNVCQLTYCRIEEVQEIQADTGTSILEGTATQPLRPRPLKRPQPEEDIRNYRRIRMIETNFKVCRADRGDAVANRPSPEAMRHERFDARLQATSNVDRRDVVVCGLSLDDGAVCDIKFSRRDNLWRHQRKIHGRRSVRIEEPIMERTTWAPELEHLSFQPVRWSAWKVKPGHVLDHVTYGQGALH